MGCLWCKKDKAQMGEPGLSWKWTMLAMTTTAALVLLTSGSG